MYLPKVFDLNSDRFIQSASSKRDLKLRLEMFPDKRNSVLDSGERIYKTLLADQMFTPQKENKTANLSKSKKERKRARIFNETLNSSKMCKKLDFQLEKTTQELNLESLPLLLEESPSFEEEPFKALEASGMRADFYLSLLAWSARDQVLIGLERTLTLLDLKDNVFEDLARIDNYAEYISSVCFDSQGNKAVYCDNRGSLSFVDLNKFISSSFTNVHEGRICVSASSSEDLLATGSADKSIKITDLRQKKAGFTLQGHSQEICGLSWSSRGMLASGANDNKLAVWDLRSTRWPVFSTRQHKSAVKALAWSPVKSNVLVSGGGTQDRRICLWDTVNSKELCSVETNSQICNLHVDKKSKQIFSCNGFSANDIKVYDFNSLKEIGKLKGHADRVIYMAVSPKGDCMVTGSGDESINFWKICTEKEKERKEINLGFR